MRGFKAPDVGRGGPAKKKFLMKNEKQTPEKNSILEIVQKFKINVPMLAGLVGMSESAFKNKLYRSNASYGFTDDERLRVHAELLKIAKEVARFANSGKSSVKTIKGSQKSKILS